MASRASYLHLDDARWDAVIAQADQAASPCTLCPRACRVNRHKGKSGFCRAGNTMRISSIFAHHGEEPPFTGTKGSGTVFFSHCTLRCVFCQNHQISHNAEGRAYTPEELASHLLDLQRQGCHNVNLVTPTHFLPWWLRAVRIAAGQGLTLPLLYNCGGYETVQTVELLRDVVDIWLPDMKYGDDGPATELSSAPDYVEVNQAAVSAMMRAAGPLRVGADGVAYRGLCIRHLVLPQGLAGSGRIAEFLASSFDPGDITISLMAQYRPLHRACEHPAINRRLRREEYEPVRRMFEQAGFEGYYQTVEGMDEKFVIDFTRRKHEPLTGE